MTGSTEPVSKYLTAEGSIVTIEDHGHDLSSPWDSSVRIRTKRPYGGVPDGLQLRELHIARRGNYDYVIEHVIGAPDVEVVDAQGGQYLIARSSISEEQGLALWRGDWHEIATWMPESSMPSSEALRYFADLDFADSELGLRVVARDPAVHSVETREVSKRVPGVGFLDIYPPSEGVNWVPSWAGARVASGEVWRKDQGPDDEGRPTELLVLANASAVALLTGDLNRKHEVDSRVRFLDSVRKVSWTQD